MGSGRRCQWANDDRRTCGDDYDDEDFRQPVDEPVLLEHLLAAPDGDQDSERAEADRRGELVRVREGVLNQKEQLV